MLAQVLFWVSLVLWVLALGHAVLVVIQSVRFGKKAEIGHHTFYIGIALAVAAKYIFG